MSDFKVEVSFLSGHTVQRAVTSSIGKAFMYALTARQDYQKDNVRINVHDGQNIGYTWDINGYLTANKSDNDVKVVELSAEYLTEFRARNRSHLLVENIEVAEGDVIHLVADNTTEDITSYFVVIDTDTAYISKGITALSLLPCALRGDLS